MFAYVSVIKDDLVLCCVFLLVHLGGYHLLRRPKQGMQQNIFLTTSVSCGFGVGVGHCAHGFCQDAIEIVVSIALFNS